MRPDVFIISLPLRNEKSCDVQIFEQVLVQALGAKPTVQRLDKSVLLRFSWRDEMQSNSVSRRPLEHRAASEFGPVVERDDLRFPSLKTQLFEDLDDVCAFDRRAREQIRQHPRMMIEHRQDLQFLIRTEPVMDEIHRPDFVSLLRNLERHAKMSKPFVFPP